MNDPKLWFGLPGDHMAVWILPFFVFFCVFDMFFFEVDDVDGVFLGFAVV